MLIHSEIPLPEHIRGRLYLSRIPGRSHGFDVDRQEIVDAGIEIVWCLTSLEEARQASQEYAQAIEMGEMPWIQWMFSIPDGGIPSDLKAYLVQVKGAAEYLRSGGSLLIHCVAGLGRTPMTAACVLIMLGLNYDSAMERVFGFGLEPESPRQGLLIRRVAHEIEMVGKRTRSS
jgi:hypothetical protein